MLSHVGLRWFSSQRSYERGSGQPCLLQLREQNNYGGKQVGLLHRLVLVQMLADVEMAQESRRHHFLKISFKERKMNLIRHLSQACRCETAAP